MTRLTLPSHWPVKDRARYKPLDWFVPYPKNARAHPTDQVTLLARLLTEFGPDQDIVVDEDRVILKGHGRLMAAREAGLTHFPFTQRLGLSQAEKDAMRFADNQVALLSTWDKALSLEGLSRLKTGGYDLLRLGFPEAQLRGFGVPMGGGADPEETPAPPTRPIVKSGDLWLLGGASPDLRELHGRIRGPASIGGQKARSCFYRPPLQRRVSIEPKRSVRFD